MTHEIVPFQFEANQVRVVQGEDGEPLFVAADVCKALSYANTSQAVADNVEPEDKVYLVDRGGISSSYTPNSTLLINESGLYSLILTSRKSEAKRFKKWVTSEVLPAIRKTGGYAPQKQASAVMTPLQQLRAMVDELEAQQAKLSLHEDRLNRLEAKAITAESGSQYFSVLAYFKYAGLGPVDQTSANVIGRKAAAISRQRGLRIGRTGDQRFGFVNTYHESILSEVVTTLMENNQ